jgi:hypothetical protein
VSITQADHDRPWFVVVTLRDGTVFEEAFPNRTMAEAFLESLPFSDIGAARAMLRPSGYSDN